MDDLTARVRRLRRTTRRVAQAVADNCRVAARAADKQVHASPWRFMTITALAAAAIGYVAGYSRVYHAPASSRRFASENSIWR
jgi:ElaB/YqjD/DUF883 family membrane-anchored ribosome-binding protein